MIWNKGTEDFEAEVFLVTDAIGAALDEADLVVDALDEAKADLVIHFAVGDDAVPMPLNQGGELFQGLQALPSQLSFPVVEELSGPRWMLIGPEVAEGFFEEVSLEEPLVGIEEGSQRFAAFRSEMIPVGEQGVALALDEAAVFFAQAEVFLSANPVDGVIEMAQDMELVVNDSDVRTKADDVGKRLPHVHHRELDFRGFSRAEPLEEHFQVFLFASVAAKPDGTPPIQVADNDPINMAFADGDFINADGAGSRCPGPIHQHLKILLLQIPDRIPVQTKQTRHMGNRLLPTHPAHIQGKTFGEMSTVSQPFQAFGFHLATDVTVHATNVRLQINALVPTIQVPNPSSPSVVMMPPAFAAAPANCFFVRRIRVMTRACGSPQTPFKVRKARKPGKLYSSCNVRPVFMRRSLSQKSSPVHNPVSPRKTPGFQLKITHSETGRPF